MAADMYGVELSREYLRHSAFAQTFLWNVVLVRGDCADWDMTRCPGTRKDPVFLYPQGSLLSIFGYYVMNYNP